MMDMMNMGGGGSASMNMGGGAAGSMNMSGGMASMGNMQGMAGMDPAAMNNQMSGMAQGWQNGMAGNIPWQNGVQGMQNNSLLGGILNLTIDIFVILLFVGMIVGAVILFKRYLFDGELLAVKPKAACAKCGQVLRSDWNACPKCGESRAAAPVNTVPQTV